MSDRAGVWRWDPEAIRADLEALGYDVDLADAHLAEGGGSLTARRDRGARAHLIVVDAGGRIRARVTVVLAETGRTIEIAAASFRAVTQSRSASTITGTLSNADQLRALVASLDGFVPAQEADLPLPSRIEPERPG